MPPYLSLAHDGDVVASLYLQGRKIVGRAIRPVLNGGSWPCGLVGRASGWRRYWDHDEPHWARRRHRSAGSTVEIPGGSTVRYVPPADYFAQQLHYTGSVSDLFLWCLDLDEPEATHTASALAEHYVSALSSLLTPPAVLKAVHSCLRGAFEQVEAFREEVADAQASFSASESWTNVLDERKRRRARVFSLGGRGILTPKQMAVALGLTDILAFQWAERLQVEYVHQKMARGIDFSAAFHDTEEACEITAHDTLALLRTSCAISPDEIAGDPSAVRRGVARWQALPRHPFLDLHPPGVLTTHG